MLSLINSQNSLVYCHTEQQKAANPHISEVVISTPDINSGKMTKIVDQTLLEKKKKLNQLTFFFFQIVLY